ncbi:MAG: hypothetical protein PHU25_17830 [Deltaproteobacteria bacterium]|nr:hypothetical protein [Deltaproteobacteria bacterium]
MGVRARGVQSIRTLASVLGTGTHSNERHVHQFQLASLELERTRRTREKRTAFRRIMDIDARLVEIDDLIRRHQEALGLKGDEEPSQGHSRARNNGEAAPEKRRVLRY